MIRYEYFGKDRYYHTELDNLESVTERINEHGYRKVSRLIETSLISANEAMGEYTSEQLNALIRLLSPEYVRKTSDSGYTVLVAEKSVLIPSGALTNAQSADGTEMLSSLATPIASGMLVNRENGWELKSLYVTPDRQGKGVGSFVINKLEEKAGEKGAEKLYVEAGRFPATTGFYEKRGYETIGEKRYENVRGQNLDFIVMEKTIR